MILLTCAVEAELAFWRDRESVETLVTGVGPVEAACATAAALARRPYELVVSAGLAGVFVGEARIGDGVVVGEDSMEIALETGDSIALPRGERTIVSARSDPTLAEQLRRKGFPVLRGITVAHVTASEVTAGRLGASGAQVESMEGFAVLRAAERAGVRAIEVRGISNRCGPRESSGWDFGAGISGLQRILEILFATRAAVETAT